MHDDAIEIETAVHDAGIVQPPELAPQRSDADVVGDRPAVGITEHGRQRRTRRSDDDQSVTTAGAARGHERRHVHAGALGQQRDEALVLDEVDAAEPGAALAAAIPGEPPERRQHLGIPRVAPVDLDEQRSVAIAALEQHDTFALHRRRRQVGDPNAQLGQGEGDPRFGRTPSGRSVHEVDDRRRQRAGGERGDGARGHGDLGEQGGHHLRADEPPAEVAERPAQMRRGRRDHRAGDDEQSGREDRRPVGVEEEGEGAAVVVHHHRRDDRGEEHCQYGGGELVTAESTPAAERGDHHQSAP